MRRPLSPPPLTPWFEHRPTLRLVFAGSDLRPARFRSDDHFHSFLELGVVSEGRCDWVLGNSRRRRLAAGDLILVGPGTVHREEGRERCRLAWVGLELDPDPGRHLAPWLHRRLHGGAAFPSVERLIHLLAAEWGADAPGAASMRDALLRQLLVHLFRLGLPRRPHAPAPPASPERRQTRIAQAAAEQLRRGVGEPLSVAQMARYYSMCPAHFSVVFKQEHGVSPRRFLTLARLDRARALLSDTDWPVKVIAAQCGFSDPGHFSRKFRSCFRRSPSAERARPREA